MDQLPDSRVTRHKKSILTKMGWCEVVYCANCGVEHGVCTEDLTGIFYICDSCVEKHGPPVGVTEVD